MGCSECNIIQYFVMCCSFNCVGHVVYYLGGSGIAVPFKDYERLMTSEPMRDLFTFSTFRFPVSLLLNKRFTQLCAHRAKLYLSLIAISTGLSLILMCRG